MSLYNKIMALQIYLKGIYAEYQKPNSTELKNVAWTENKNNFVLTDKRFGLSFVFTKTEDMGLQVTMCKIEEPEKLHHIDAMEGTDLKNVLNELYLIGYLEINGVNKIFFDACEAYKSEQNENTGK